MNCFSSTRNASGNKSSCKQLPRWLCSAVFGFAKDINSICGWRSIPVCLLYSHVIIMNSRLEGKPSSDRYHSGCVCVCVSQTTVALNLHTQSVINIKWNTGMIVKMRFHRRVTAAPQLQDSPSFNHHYTDVFLWNQIPCNPLSASF